jgi:2-C-methyl-D-erythritol 4-phosphate cytidylyltransferase
MSRFAVILPAAGRSSRFGGKEKKPFALLDGRAVWLRTVELFITRNDICQCLLIVAPEDRELFRTRYAANIAFLDVQIVEGGAERFESVANALKILKDEAEFVAVHDAVRPCLEAGQLDAVFKRATETGAAILGVPIADTIKRVDGQQQVQETLSRQGLWLAQTPQVFHRDWILEAYANRGKLGKDITDDAQLVEAAGHAVHVVEGSPTNIKITRQSDLALAKAILQSRPPPKPTGPAHPFAEEEMWR